MNRGIPKVSILRRSEERTGDVSTWKVRRGKRRVLVRLIFVPHLLNLFFPLQCSHQERCPTFRIRLKPAPSSQKGFSSLLYFSYSNTPTEFFCWYFVGMVSPSFGGTFAIPVSAAVQSKTSNHTGGNSWSKAREQDWLRSFSLLIEFNIRYGDWCRRQNCGTSLDHTSQSSQFHKDRKSTCTQLRENTTLVSFKALAVALKS